MGYREKKEMLENFVEEMLNNEYDPSEVLRETHGQLICLTSKSQKLALEWLEREMVNILQDRGYRIYKNLSFFQGEQVDEFVCQLLPYYNDQQMVLC